MTNGLHEYENWLSNHIDPFIQASGSEVLLTFDETVAINIASCNDFDSIAVAANQLRSYLERRKPTESHPLLPNRHLLLCFCVLVVRKNNPRLNAGKIQEQIDELWGGYDWQHSRWRNEL